MATGCEGRISTLKRGYGWDRSRIDTTEGARIWTGHGVLAHNLIKSAASWPPDPPGATPWGRPDPRSQHKLPGASQSPPDFFRSK